MDAEKKLNEQELDEGIELSDEALEGIVGGVDLRKLSPTIVEGDDANDLTDSYRSGVIRKTVIK